MSDDNIIESIERLTRAAEAKRQSEIDRISAEKTRAEIESRRLTREQDNNQLLLEILENTKTLLCSLDDHSSNHDHLTGIVKSILTLVQVVAIRIGGDNLDSMTDLVRRSVERSMDVNIGDNAKVGSIVEGNQYINSLHGAVEAIQEDDPEKVEETINSLPEDIVDVVLASLNGPLAAAKMVVNKVGDKWRVTRESN